jgi:hypothetical protein
MLTASIIITAFVDILKQFEKNVNGNAKRAYLARNY